MSEASSGAPWRLSVWFEHAGDFTTFDFDGKPEEESGTKVVSYYGKREGRTVRVHVIIEQVSAWSLEEMRR